MSSKQMGLRILAVIVLTTILWLRDRLTLFMPLEVFLVFLSLGAALWGRGS